MNAKLFVLAITIAFPWNGVVQAQPIFIGEPITSDTTINAGNPYLQGFGAYDAGGGSPTVDLVDGGSVGFWATLFDDSHLMMTGGAIGGVVAVADHATFTMTGGVIGASKSVSSEVSDIVGDGTGAIHLPAIRSPSILRISSWNGVKSFS